MKRKRMLVLRRWFVKNSIHSLRVRILLGFLLVSLTTLSIATIGYWYQKQSAQLSRLRSLSEKVTLEIVRMQKAEAEFNSISVLQKDFFVSGKDTSLIQYEVSYASMVVTLHQLKAALPIVMPDAQGDIMRRRIDRMVEKASQMQVSMSAYAAKMRQRGFLNYGILGEMRAAAHSLEQSSQLARIDLLQLRRHEKDYLLRRDLSYFEDAGLLGRRLMDAAVTGRRIEEAALLQRYLSQFEALVSLELQLGLIGEGGLRPQMAAMSTDLSKQVADLNEILLQEALEKGDRYQRVFLALAVTAVLLTLLFSLYFSKQIIRPLRQLTHFIHNEIEGQFKAGGPQLRIHGQHELSDLGADVNAMVLQIRQQLSEITKQGEALAARNTDLTALNKALKQTQEKQAALLRVREKIHSIISHDLRAPVNGMAAYLEIILEDATQITPSMTVKFAGQMLQSVQRLGEMMENLLRWSLFHSGELAYEPKWIHVEESVARCMELYTETASKKSVTIVLGTLAVGQVFADSEMLDFTLRNLITNAIKFSHAGGQVRVHAAMVAAEMIGIHVQDQGVGMAAAQIDRILVHGEHLSTTGTQKEKGTGFGLMLCRDFVARHGGQLTVQSVLGKGTTVTFTLPFQSHAGKGFSSKFVATEASLFEG